MAIITGLTAAEMREIEANSIVDGDVVGDNLVLTKHNGTTVNAGNVRGPVGANASVQLAEKPATDLPSTYPDGISTFDFAATAGWPTTYAVVTTVKENSARAYQMITEKTSGKMWIRTAADDTWGSWMKTVQQDSSGNTTVDKLRITNTSEATATSSSHGLQVGPDAGLNVIIDGNEIMARNNGVGAALFSEFGYATDLDPASASSLTRKAYVDTVNADALVARLAQRSMTGGGVRKVSTTGVSWSQRFITMGLGLNTRVPSGYFEISMPADGTVIPVYSTSGAGSVTVAAGTIPLLSWQALYYELPLGSGVASQPGRFRIVYYTGGAGFDVPSTWILIAIRNGDTRTSAYMWGDGRSQDVWKALTLQNSWVNYGSSWQTAAWRYTNDGQIKLRGLIKSGSVGVNIPCVTFGADQSPEGGLPDVAMIFTAMASGGVARVDMHSNGELCVMALIAPATNAYVSLEGISWFVAGS